MKSLLRHTALPLTLQLILAGCGTVVGNGFDIEGQDEQTDTKAFGDALESPSVDSLKDVTASPEILQNLLRLLFIPGCATPWSKLTLPLSDSLNYRLELDEQERPELMTIDPAKNYIRAKILAASGSDEVYRQYGWQQDLKVRNSEHEVFVETYELENSLECQEPELTDTTPVQAQETYQMTVDGIEGNSYAVAWVLENIVPDQNMPVTLMVRHNKNGEEISTTKAVLKD